MKHKPLEVGGEFPQRSIFRNAQLYSRLGLVSARSCDPRYTSRSIIGSVRYTVCAVPEGSLMC